MKVLKIHWQRLLIAGETCPRCRASEEEIHQACRALERFLDPLGIKVVLEKEELGQGAFHQDPLQSNRLLINGRPLEEWLAAQVGQSPCCGPCGHQECRTLVVGDRVYETIPAALIVQAGLMAARQLPFPR